MKICDLKGPHYWHFLQISESVSAEMEICDLKGPDYWQSFQISKSVSAEMEISDPKGGHHVDLDKLHNDNRQTFGSYSLWGRGQ